MNQHKSPLPPKQTKTRKTLYLPEEIAEAIDAQAKQQGVSFIQMVAEILERCLKESE